MPNVSFFAISKQTCLFTVLIFNWLDYSLLETDLLEREKRRNELIKSRQLICFLLKLIRSDGAGVGPHWQRTERSIQLQRCTVSMAPTQPPVRTHTSPAAPHTAQTYWSKALSSPPTTWDARMHTHTHPFPFQKNPKVFWWAASNRRAPELAEQWSRSRKDHGKANCMQVTRSGWHTDN